MNGKQAALMLSRRGRNRSAPPKLRDNNYRDENGQYQLSDGLQLWHTRVVDYSIANPAAKIKDMAKEFGVSAVWMGQLLKTDAFKEYYAMRMKTHQGLVHETIVNRLQSVAGKALDKMDEMLDKPELTIGTVKDTADMALKTLGYGVTPSGINVNMNGGDTPQQTTVTISSTSAQQARKLMAARSKEIPVDQDVSENYKYVTSALETEGEPEKIEDAVVIESSKES